MAIDLHTYRTSNGRKASIMLEECGLDYRARIVDITAGEQHEAGFLAVSPNGRVPAIVDRDGPGGAPLALFESGAILLYLARKTGMLLPADAAGRWTAIQWLMFQMGGVGPMFGQAFHFLHQHPPDASAGDVARCRARYVAEARRLCAVMDLRLSRSAFLAGPDYGVADVAAFPWIALRRWLGLDIASTPHLARWYRTIRERPAVRRGMDVPSRRQLAAHARERTR